MTKEVLAGRLNGRQYLQEITSVEEKAAKEAGLLVVFGASDDLCELRGAIDDEVGVYDGGTVFIDVKNRDVAQGIDDDDVAILEKYKVYESLRLKHFYMLQIQAQWCDDPNYSWTYETSAPHSVFDIMEDDDKYCRGIVIDLKTL